MLEIWMQPVHQTVIYNNQVFSFVFCVFCERVCSSFGSWRSWQITTVGCEGLVDHAHFANHAHSEMKPLVIGQRLDALNSLPSRRHCGRSEILWVCCRGRAAHTHISGDRLSHTDLRGDLPLVLNSETVNTGLYFYLHYFPVFWQRIKEYSGVIIGWNLCELLFSTAWVRRAGCASAHSPLDYRTLLTLSQWSVLVNEFLNAASTPHMPQNSCEPRSRWEIPPVGLNRFYAASPRGAAPTTQAASHTAQDRPFPPRRLVRLRRILRARLKGFQFGSLKCWRHTAATCSTRSTYSPSRPHP